ncbi:MAG TPA: GntR family transcriptional regulator [Blastocatellia bacterium]|nr:GntR family transcriptional regulator [Blastocatellia bacterium]
MARSKGSPKYQQVFDALAKEIVSGKYKPGQKLPSETTLIRQFGASRITVSRAVRELKERGLVERVAGSGTYVRAHVPDEGDSLFGLLIPNLGEMEIFEPICQGMAGAPVASRYGLLWGRSQSTSEDRQQRAMDLCNEFIQRNVAGVFFAPLELTSEKDATNETVLNALDRARIPVVLLDRSELPFPRRGKHDLVGIDNRRAGYLAADHLLKAGCRRIVFIGYPNGAPTVQLRAAGFREALFDCGVTELGDWVQLVPAITQDEVKRVMDSLGPQAFVCVNDRTAGPLMHAVLKLGYQIPRDVRIVGIDDVEYASLLPVPLTTIHQPCREIGQAAVSAMFDRIRRPDMMPRDILLDCELVVRESCGVAM